MGWPNKPPLKELTGTGWFCELVPNGLGFYLEFTVINGLDLGPPEEPDVVPKPEKAFPDEDETKGLEQL